MKYCKVIMLLSVTCLVFTTEVLGQALRAPTDLNAQVVTKAGDRYVSLTWKSVKGKHKHVGYNVFVNFPPDTSLFLWGKAGIIWKNQYAFKITKEYAATYYFAVCSIINFPAVKRSAKTAKLKVEVSSARLPFLQLSSFKQQGDNVSLSWHYPEIKDLKSFRLWVNDTLRVSDIPSTKRAFTYQLQQQAQKSKVELEAITTSGVTSNRTQPRIVKQEKK